MRRDRSRRKAHQEDAAAWLPAPRETRAAGAIIIACRGRNPIRIPRQAASLAHEAGDAILTDADDITPHLPAAPPPPSSAESSVHPQAPAVDVLNIQVHSGLERRIPSCCDLPKSCHSRQHVQPRQVFNRIGGKIIQRMRSRPHQAHLACHHVPELRKFVQTVAAQ